MAQQFERTVGVPMRYDMLYVGQWKLNLLLADRYRAGRVFLAGDSAHLVIPTGGLRHEHRRRRRDRSVVEARGHAPGMGRARPARTRMNRTAAGRRSQRRRLALCVHRPATLATQYRPDIHDDTAAAARPRQPTRVADVEQRKTNEMIGAELGYRYVGSPLIWDEPGGPTPVSVRADLVERRQAAPCLARRRCGAARPDRRRLYAAAAGKAAPTRRRSSERCGPEARRSTS